MRKISFNLIKESLTRDEMRSISGGSGSGPNCWDNDCKSDYDCNAYCPKCSDGICYTF